MSKVYNLSIDTSIQILFGTVWAKDETICWEMMRVVSNIGIEHTSSLSLFISTMAMLLEMMMMMWEYT